MTQRPVFQRTTDSPPPPQAEHPAPDPLVAGRIPEIVRRRWSDALAAAGLFTEALQIHPTQDRADVVRQVELAVLAEDPHTALDLIAGLDTATVAATASPWLDLLNRCARVQIGEVGLLPDVLAAARLVPNSPAVAWVVALAAAATGDLDQAAPAARAARAGGCRDLRITAITAADRAADGDDWAAIEMIRAAQKIALPGEDPAAMTATLLDQAGHRGDAQRLAARAGADSSLPPAARAAWHEAGQAVGGRRKQLWRRSMSVAGSLGTRHREKAEAHRLELEQADLTCRCYGSTGWIGDTRLLYTARHLSTLLSTPMPGLDARLLKCRATNLTFLELPGRQITLPVNSSTRPDHDETPDPSPENHPTPGMGVSLGLAIHA